MFVRNDFLKIYRNLQNLCIQEDKYREKKKKERTRIFVQAQKLIKRQRDDRKRVDGKNGVHC